MKQEAEEQRRAQHRRAALRRLHDYAQVGDVTSIRRLFHEHGHVMGSIDACRRGRNTALHIALDHNQDGQLLTYLIDNGANVNVMNGKGYAPLALAILRSSTRAKRENNSTIAVRKLIDAGATWNAKYESGIFIDRTPLSVALEFGHEGVIDLLARLTAEAAAQKTTTVSNDNTNSHEENNLHGELPTVSTPITEEESSSSKKLALPPTVTPKKGYAVCPICNIQVKYPTAMSRILDDQLSIEKRLHNNGDFLLAAAGGGKKQRRQRKYITRRYMDELVSQSCGLPYARLCNIEYHQLENMRLRKEISESFGILHAVLDCCVRLGIIVDPTTTTTTTTDITITDNNNSNDECNGRSYNSNGIVNFDNVCLIDLCSGKGITTALCDALNQGRCQAVGEENNNNNNNNYFLAIDKMLPHTIPHFLQNQQPHSTTTNNNNNNHCDDNIDHNVRTTTTTTTTTTIGDSSVKYLCRDIMADKFFHEIDTIVHEQTQLHNRTCILVGMHLCGTLSERAIDIFHRTKVIAGIILSPCCLPKLHEYDKGMTAFVKGKRPPSTGRTSESYDTTNNSELLYNYFRWANYLKERVSGRQVIRYGTSLRNTDDTKFSGGRSDDDDDDDTLDNVNVRLYTDEEMHTEKNAIIVGLRKRK